MVWFEMLKSVIPKNTFSRRNLSARGAGGVRTDGRLSLWRHCRAGKMCVRPETFEIFVYMYIYITAKSWRSITIQNNMLYTAKACDVPEIAILDFRSEEWHRYTEIGAGRALAVGGEVNRKTNVKMPKV